MEGLVYFERFGMGFGWEIRFSDARKVLLEDFFGLMDNYLFVILSTSTKQVLVYLIDYRFSEANA